MKEGEELNRVVATTYKDDTNEGKVDALNVKYRLTVSLCHFYVSVKQFRSVFDQV